MHKSTPSQPITVMPLISRSVWFAVAARMWNLVRSYFDTPQRRSAAVLSFRRHGMRARGFRPMKAEDGCAGKKTNGSVRWSEDCKIVSQEGGRG